MGSASIYQRNGRKTPVHYSRKLAARILARLAQGESLTAICRDPDMPRQRAVQNWCRKYPAFGAGYVKARDRVGAVRAEICERLARGEPLRTICADPGLPSRVTVQRWVRADRAFRDRYQDARWAWWRCRGWRRPYAPELVEEIFDRIVLNESLRSICCDPHMPAYFTVLGWLRRYHDFGIGYRKARESQWFTVDDLRIEVRREMVVQGYPLREKLIPKLVPHNRGWPSIFKDEL